MSTRIFRMASLFRNGSRQFSQTAALKSSAPYVYRALPQPAKKWVIMAEVQGAFMWWWIFWHVFTDYGHLLGEFPYPDSSAWTDAELGVPPDEEGL